jgi:glutamyl/glutaminyl-tRNA synthetase
MDKAELHAMTMMFLPEEIKAYPNFTEIIGKLESVLRERLTKFSDLTVMVENNELQFYFTPPVLDTTKICYKNTTSEQTIIHLEQVISLLESSEVFDVPSIKIIIDTYAAEVGRGDVLHPMRYSLSGQERSPDPFTIASIIGKDESVARLQSAINLLRK